MKKRLEILEQVKNGTITPTEADAQLFGLCSVMSIFPKDEEIIKHSENMTDFLERNGTDMSVARNYICAGADLVKRLLRNKLKNYS